MGNTGQKMTICNLSARQLSDSVMHQVVLKWASFCPKMAESHGKSVNSNQPLLNIEFKLFVLQFKVILNYNTFLMVW